MQIKNISGADRHVDPKDAEPFFAAANEVVEVPDAVGKSLLEQSDIWAKPTTKKGN